MAPSLCRCGASSAFRVDRATGSGDEATSPFDGSDDRHENEVMSMLRMPGGQRAAVLLPSTELAAPFGTAIGASQNQYGAWKTCGKCIFLPPRTQEIAHWKIGTGFMELPVRRLVLTMAWRTHCRHGKPARGVDRRDRAPHLVSVRGHEVGRTLIPTKRRPGRNPRLSTIAAPGCGCNYPHWLVRGAATA